MNKDRIYYLENLGCAKNQVDAEIIIAALDSSGWVMTRDPFQASLIIVNTCGFIESAKEESIDVLVSYKDSFPDAAVVAAGCLAQRYSRDLAESMPELDGIFGNNTVAAIADYADAVLGQNSMIVKVPELNNLLPEDIERDDKLSISRKTLLSGASTAFVKLAEGCCNNCSFCAIPIIRGPLRSRRPDSIIMEIEHLVKSGIGEINLVAQDLGSYGKDLSGDDGVMTGECLLPQLIDRIEEIEGDFIVRMLYIHPDNFPLEVLDICASGKRIVPYFDIPFQHASSPVLLSMNRHGDAEIYLDLVRRIREKLPDAVIRTTFLLGFPGEKKKDVDVLERFIREAQLEWAGFFSYSREEGTAAYNMEGPLKYKKHNRKTEKNVQRMQMLQSSITSDLLKRFVGRRLRLIVEEGVSREDLYLCRAWFQAPEVDSLVVLHAEEGSLLPGDFIEVEITGINGIDLEARQAEG